jgi:hypothetical protein
LDLRHPFYFYKTDWDQGDFMSSTLKFIGIFVFICICAGALAWSRRPVSRSAQVPARTDTVTRAELNELKSELAQTQSALRAAYSRSVGPQATPSASPGAAPPPEPPAAPPPINVALEDTRDTLDARFHSESADRGWALEASVLIRKNLEGVIAGNSQLLSLDCRASLCRAEVKHDDLAAHQAFIQNAFVTAPASWQGPTLASYREDGRARGGIVSVLFFGRDGTSTIGEETSPAF